MLYTLIDAENYWKRLQRISIRSIKRFLKLKELFNWHRSYICHLARMLVLCPESPYDTAGQNLVRKYAVGQAWDEERGAVPGPNQPWRVSP